MVLSNFFIYFKKGLMWFTVFFNVVIQLNQIFTLSLIINKKRPKKSTLKILEKNLKIWRKFVKNQLQPCCD